MTVKKPTASALARRVRARLRDLGDPRAAAGARNYFKAYDNVQFYGVKLGIVRKLVRESFVQVRGVWAWTDALAFCDILIRDPHLEAKAVGVELLGRYRRDFQPGLLGRVKRWLASGYGSNWATVDDVAPRLITPLLLAFPELVHELRRWTGSSSLWIRRAAVVALVKPARAGTHLPEAYDFAHRLFGDREDLMHKATGWLLREAGKTDPRRLERFLLAHGPGVPRTTVRYAIERFPEAARLRILRQTKGSG